MSLVQRSAALGLLLGAGDPSPVARYIGNRLYSAARRRFTRSRPLGATGSHTSLAMLRRMQRGRRYGGRRYIRRPATRRRYTRSKRSWQARARMKVGNPRNYSTSKTTETNFPNTAITISTSTVSPRNLIDIGGTSSNQINARQRDTCIVNGIKIHVSFLNLTANRLYVNWAIIHAKQGQVINSTTPDFFRAYNNERSFNADASATVTELSYSVAQINTDEFVVLKRGKFMLTPTATAALQGRYNYGAATKEISCYLKLGRQFYFDDGSSTPQDQVTFVCWCNDPSLGVGQIANALQYRFRSIAYWREPRGG